MIREQTRQKALQARMTSFSLSIINLCKTIKQDSISRPLIDQLLRSATSIGANYAEANNASSKVDFRNKIFIAKKEAAETRYWLQLIDQFTADKNLIMNIDRECHELLMILQTIINSLKNGS